MPTPLTNLTNVVANAPAEGTGVFDVLMETIEYRLQEQYDSGRITGAEFATVYIGALQSALQEAVRFTLEKDESALKDAILQATVEKQWGYNIEVDSNGELTLGGTTGAGVVDQQILEATEKVELVTGQIAKVYADTALTGQQQETEKTETTDASGGMAKSKQDLVAGQITKVYADTSLTEQQLETEKTQTTDAIGGMAKSKQDLVAGQIAKVYADTSLTAQQEETEKTQTTDASGGMAKSKQDLVAAQTLGFASDTKQKVLKQMLEGYAVTLSIAGNATAPDATKEPQIDALVDELLTDVGSAVNIP
ncbi:MAG: hypothetical protein GY820_10510 [Gammaproteobacteria bacterium]|nr:hypothetical protein [Gammaproteobacteria bacterium]